MTGPPARAVLAAGLALAAVSGAGCSSGHGRAAPTTTAGSSSPTPSATTTSTVPTTEAPTTTTTIDPGLLPQTVAVPDSGATLTRSMEVLWRAMVTGNPDPALGVFFPRTAYVRLKDIADPSSDYADRLVALYRLDIQAYHDYLGPGVGSAALHTVAADPGYAAWIPPGRCYNSIGYWHLPGVRLVYSEGGRLQSFAVASLISWHSVWYVVHLGPVIRSSQVGLVDQPAYGVGTPGPPGGC